MTPVNAIEVGIDDNVWRSRATWRLREESGSDGRRTLVRDLPFRLHRVRCGVFNAACPSVMRSGHESKDSATFGKSQRQPMHD
jgi:hypothetical protein